MTLSDIRLRVLDTRGRPAVVSAVQILELALAVTRFVDAATGREGTVNFQLGHKADLTAVLELAEATREAIAGRVPSDQAGFDAAMNTLFSTWFGTLPTTEPTTVGTLWNNGGLLARKT